MSSRIRSRSLCSRLSRQGFPCSWCGLGAVLLFVMAYPPVAETSSEEIPVLFSTTSQEHTPFTFLQESGQNQNKINNTGFSYDAAGNLTGDGSFSYTWDAESRMKSAAGVNYTYDGDDRRVQKSNGKFYWYGAGSDPITETDAAGNDPIDYIFFGGKRIARRDASGNVTYYFADHLGTARVVTNATGTILDDSDFYPFGGEHVVVSSSGNNYKFTGKERDTETQLDDFDARYYSPQFGRFHSPDWSAIPAPVPYADLGNPQTLNLYAYVKNNPLNLTDPTGHLGVGQVGSSEGMAIDPRMRSPGGNAYGCMEDGSCESGDFSAVDRKSTRLNSSHRCISYAVF